MDKKKGMVLTVLALVSLVVITVGVTYAFFNYAKEGTTENSVTTGTITFLYTEVSGVGKGISLSDAYPISDIVGKAQLGEGKVFDFKVTSNTPNKTSIPYEVTARKKSDSTLDETAVKLYLTKVSGTDEEEVLLSKYSELVQTTKVETSKYTEKTIYQGKVPANSNNYEQAFKLRMWIDENTDFSPNSDGTYPYNGKTFTITVNVYANAKVITDEEIALESNANISNISVGGNTLTKIEGQDYDYEVTLPDGTTNTTINVETESPYATVRVEKIDSLVYRESNIKRLSTIKTLNLTNGDNYFKVIVTSENKKVTNEYKIKIYARQQCTEYVKGQSWDFYYVNGEQEFVAQCDGVYKLETWGAQGGSIDGYIGGYGGYSTGSIYLSRDSHIYVVVGGRGIGAVNRGESLDGGYNGGGSVQGYSSLNHINGSGGGATHIASNSGLLSELSDNRKSIFIVSGGGGGARNQDNHEPEARWGNGGTGGGYIAGGAASSFGNTDSLTIVTEVSGTQTTGYAFGLGEVGRGQSAGGGGWFGGFSGTAISEIYTGSGGGGSGYIGNTLLTNKVMYCYNCKDSSEESTKTISTTNVSEEPISNYAKIGDGYAKITYLGENN